ncbi:class I adenylate-forming enzyme family protein [Halobacteriales archaeon Cl-PHB]
MTNRYEHTLQDVFEKSLNKYRERVALQFEGEQYTYGNLNELANSLAHALRNAGVGIEDRVALLLSNCPEYVVADLAVIKTGATKVPLNDMLSTQDIEYILEDSKASSLVCGPNFLEEVAPIVDESEHLDTVIGVESADESLPPGFDSFSESIQSSHDGPPTPSPDATDDAAHYYTGGTTGKPKGVVHTQESLALNAFSHVVEFGVTGNDRLLLTTPLPHSAGLCLWAGLSVGATAIVKDGFSPADVLETISSEGVTFTFLVPTMIYRLLDHDSLEAADTASLRTVVYGAAPMIPARLQEGIEAFGPVFVQLYGQTEVPNLITTFGTREHELALQEEYEHRLSSAGQPCLMADVKIVDPDTGEELRPGEVGEIVATAPYTMEGYFHRPEKTEKTLQNGWVRTGDIGKIDADGYLYLLDRDSNVIITGGMNVYSTEVEDVIDEHESVRDVAVIGIPHEDWGEAVHAVVVPYDRPVSPAAIREFATERLADYKQPKSIEFVDKIPTTPFGKKDKEALRDRYWTDQDRDVA